MGVLSNLYLFSSIPLIPFEIRMSGCAGLIALMKKSAIIELATLHLVQPFG